MIICRKCQRHHADDVGRGPCECGADLTRDGIAIGAAPMASTNVFDDPAPLDPFATAAEPAPPAPDRTATAPAPVEPATPAPVRAAAPPPPTAPEVAEVAQPDLPPPPSPVEPVRPDLPPPPSEPKRRARSFNPADLAAEPEEPIVADEPTLPVGTVETSDASERARRARGVTPDEVLAAQQEPDAANVGVIADDADTDTDAGPSPAEAVTQPIATTRPPGPGEFACPTCREPNADTRRFCFNCGTGLPTRESDDEELASMTGPARRTLRSRLTGSKNLNREARTFRGKAKMAGGGQFSYAKGLSPKAKIRLAMMILGGGGAAMMLLGPYSGHVQRLLNRGPSGTSPESATIEDSFEFPNYPANSAVDGKPETGFAFFWDPEGELSELTLGDAADEAEPAGQEDPEAEAETPDSTEPPPDGTDSPPEDPATAPDEIRGPGTLVVRLEEATTVNKLYIAGGLPDSETEGPLLLRPSSVEVCGDAGTASSCQVLTLDNSTSLKKYKVNLGEVLVIRITVLDTHETDTVTYPLAVIGEIRVGK